MKALGLPLVILAASVLPVANAEERETTPPALKALSESVQLPRQTLEFKPTRDDITVGCALFSLHHSDMSKAFPLDAVRVNGKKPETAELYLKQLGKNQFELPALKIEYSSKELRGPLYLTLKVWFNELTNQYDSPLYENTPDRYALLSYGTKEDEDPFTLNARLGANRAVTLKDFKEKLAQPFVIKLKEQPLKEEWGRYPMLPPGNRLSAEELKAVEKAVRDKGEKFPIAISVADADHATVAVGEDNFFRGARSYKVARSQGSWRVEAVVPIKQTSW